MVKPSMVIVPVLLMGGLAFASGAEESSAGEIC